MSAFSVLIPAHDEARVIARTLTPLRNLSVQVTVLVVCNGCSDDTAARARAALPNARVVELSVGGKAGAINHGLRHLPMGPVIVMDADLDVTPTVLQALAAALEEPGIRVVSPAATVNLDGADRWVRAYYRVFEQHFYLAEGVGGSGVYGLSQVARDELGQLPPVLSDDDYVRHFFPLAVQRRVTTDRYGDPVRVVVRPPRRAAELIRSEARWRAGDVAVRFGTVHGRRRLSDRVRHSATHLARLRRDARVGWPAIGCYLLIKVAGRATHLLDRVRGRAHFWHRDASSRATGLGVDHP